MHINKCNFPSVINKTSISFPIIPKRGHATLCNIPVLNLQINIFNNFIKFVGLSTGMTGLSKPAIS